MSTQHPNLASEPGDRETQQPAENRARGEQVPLQIDPQQQYCEYTSLNYGNTPAKSPSSTYPTPGFYQPGYASDPTNPPLPVNRVPGYPPGANRVPNTSEQMPFYPGYSPYAPYPRYPWSTEPPRPKRDTYLLVVAIVAFACSCLVLLEGLGSLGLLALFNFSSASAKLSTNVYFSSIILLLTLVFAGLVGGGFCIYHSMRSLFFQKTSRLIWLPRFWIFLLGYIAILGLGIWMQSQGLDTRSPVLTGLLIYLSGIFPALTIMALGIRRLSFFRSRWRADSESSPTQQSYRPASTKKGQWPTTWRRFTLALVSGATLSVGLASIIELILELLMLGTQSNAINQYISDPQSGNPPSSLYGALLILLSVMAPLVEEMVKPLAVVILIGRVRSKAEAFTLGLACGIGFNLVETTGYISSSFNDWLTVALVRSGVGLLHGFGAAMVSLGWYYLTHKEEGAWLRRTWLALACAGYAVLQHAAWNGSVCLAFLPGPLGNFFQTWSWNAGPVSIDGVELVNLGEWIAILWFFIFMSGRLREHADLKRSMPGKREAVARAEGTI